VQERRILKAYKMITNVNDTIFPMKNVTKTCEKEKKTLYQRIVNCKKRKHI